jgi:GNAT superfamily N-acetyltransferase
VSLPVIRITTPADTAAVSALLSESYPALLAASYTAELLKLALPVMTIARPELLSSGTFYVADGGGGNLVACGGWTLEKPGTRRSEAGSAHIRHFATHPDWTRKGLSGLILRRCIDEARSCGVRRLECQATLNAEPFYAALGFKTNGPTDVILPPDIIFPALLMTCLLYPDASTRQTHFE